VQYTGFINSFELDQKPLSREKYLAKVRASRGKGLSFEPQVEPDPDTVRVSFSVDDLDSYGEMPVPRVVVKKLGLTVEDRIQITITRADHASDVSQDATASLQGTIRGIVADPASPMNRMRALRNIKRSYPFLVPDIDPEAMFEATEQREFEKPSELVRLEISGESNNTHANAPIRKTDLAKLDLLTGDAVVVGIRKIA
jgi:hypothetical protein